MRTGDQSRLPPPPPAVQGGGPVAKMTPITEPPGSTPTTQEFALHCCVVHCSVVLSSGVKHGAVKCRAVQSRGSEDSREVSQKASWELASGGGGQFGWLGGLASSATCQPSAASYLGRFNLSSLWELSKIKIAPEIPIKNPANG